MFPLCIVIDLLGVNTYSAKIAALASRFKLSGLVDSIPEYPILRGNIDKQGISFDDLADEISRNGTAGNICREDGLKVVYQDGWVLIRPSGTEPKVRLTIEACNDARLIALYQNVMEYLEKIPGYTMSLQQ